MNPGPPPNPVPPGGLCGVWIDGEGRAHLALGSTAEAKADFTAAASTKYHQLKARKLAEEALAKLK